ncbi:aldehyde dehydrogenase [Planosporangium flavigriseum]|uniref:Aldehyde dehydrogenase n=1 Tax=Planosporangium flavigriseum TaxID=373681 RepID=A0A8J3PLE5_9ACTN|nr:aldehyde dehydrogenase family protein [Planosporangium flavigriseum]NJC62987.1 aldehyde dehydrogenase [Planosporangium flavigriseum]GIG73144.1 aldehyde dehydrogenase [Planosporangium flavigriseum]
MSVREVTERKELANFIGNTWLASKGDEVLCRDPAAEDRVVGAVPDSTDEDVDAAVAAAAAAAAEWAARPAPERGDLLSRWRELIAENADELALLMTREMGKPLSESYAELGRARGELDYTAGEGTRILGDTIPSRVAGQLVYTLREPLGVVAAITPWNFPAVAPIRKIAPALVAGNTVVLKPALETPLTALALATLLRDAGVPEGVLNVVCGRGSSVGSRLIADRRVNGVSFTGSTGVGRTVAETVARRLGKVQLELGGKNAAYVHSAADLRRAVDHIATAAIQATGQRCTAVSRVLVQDEIADDVVELLSGLYSSYRVGPGVDPDTQVGPLINKAQFERVSGYIETGLEEGAVRTTARRSLPDGLYVEPTVLDRVTRDMVVAREEIFGPVISVLRVSDVDEAISIANDCDYGLASVVFSERLDVAMRYTQGVQAGMVHVNHGTISQPHVPFGGVKDSGSGAFSIGSTNQDFFTNTKTVYLSPTVI